MKTFSIKVALATILAITGVSAFVWIKDTILFYLKDQSENQFQSSFNQTSNETQEVFSYAVNRQGEAIAESNLVTDDALHDILRQITLCR